MRRSIIIMVFLSLWGGFASAQTAPPTVPAGGRRVALIVGIGAYEHSARLVATPSDARLMARTLTAMGFTLVGGGPQIDIDKRGFDAAIQEFGRMAQGADVALFYFSGHGLQYNGNNWLVARNSGPLSRPADLEFSFVDVGAVVRQLEAAQVRLGIIVLDACRNDPFQPSQTRDAAGSGLAPMRAPRGMLIAYATQPGNTSLDGGPSRNSPYTQALVEAMRMPGLGLFEMFNEAALRAITLSNGHQEPWMAVSPIRGDFVFMPRDGVLPAAEPPAATPAPVQTPPAAVPAPAAAVADPSFVLVNLSGRPIREMRASLATDSNWGDERLKGNVLQPGERFVLPFPRGQGCSVDVQAGFGPNTRPAEVRGLDTCAFSTLVLNREGRLLPANPDVRLVNETGRPIQAIEASLATDGNWGAERLGGRVLAPGGTLDLRLPQGASCDVDIRVRFADGTSREWRRQDTCARDAYPLR